MTKSKRILIGILFVAFAAYGIQVLIVVSWHIFPIARAEHSGRVYTIRHGFGGGLDFLPLVGLMPLSGEPVILTIEENSTGERQHLGYDLAIDVYDEYPEAFPDKQTD